MRHYLYLQQNLLLTLYLELMPRSLLMYHDNREKSIVLVLKHDNILSSLKHHIAHSFSDFP